MIKKVYFGNKESKKYIGESNTGSGAFHIIENYVKSVIGWQEAYYRFWHKDGEIVVDFGSHRNFFYINYEIERVKNEEKNEHKRHVNS